MTKTICALSVMLAAIFAAPAPAQSADDIQHYFDILWDESVPRVDTCEANGQMSAICGIASDRLVCTANAIYVGLEQSGLRDEFPRQISGLNRLLSEKAAYFNRLIANGHMQNPADMEAFEMRNFCRGINAPLVP